MEIATLMYKRDFEHATKEKNRNRIFESTESATNEQKKNLKPKSRTTIQILVLCVCMASEVNEKGGRKRRELEKENRKGACEVKKKQEVSQREMVLEVMAVRNIVGLELTGGEIPKRNQINESEQRPEFKPVCIET